jgi:hypothetical protein
MSVMLAQTPDEYMAAGPEPDTGAKLRLLPAAAAVPPVPVPDGWTGGWQPFPEEAGSVGVPRASMPQIKSEHRGAMVQYMKGRGITHSQEMVTPSSLKPSQAEYSPEKVEQAKGFEGPERSILISSDDHLLDGHHQWLSKLEPDQPIPAIRFNAPIQQLLVEAARFPSSGVDDGAQLAHGQGQKQVSAQSPDDYMKDAPPPARAHSSRLPSPPGAKIEFQPANSGWSISRAPEIRDAFQKLTGHALPVYVMGQGGVHNRLGFDHRDSMDVGLHPDSEDGQKLIGYLRQNNIPFLAFRVAIPGVATGPHIHVGYASHRTSGSFPVGSTLQQSDLDKYMAGQDASPAAAPSSAPAGPADDLSPSAYMTQAQSGPRVSSKTVEDVDFSDEAKAQTSTAEPYKPLEFKPFGKEDLDPTGQAAAGWSKFAGGDKSSKLPDSSSLLVGKPVMVSIPVPVGESGPRSATPDEIADAYLSTVGPGAVELNRKYRSETGRNLVQPEVSPDALNRSFNPQTKSYELQLSPTQGAVRILNAYGRGGLSEAQAEASRIHDENRVDLESIAKGESQPHDSHFHSWAALNLLDAPWLREGVADAGIAGAQLVHNAGMLPRAYYTAARYGYNSQQYTDLQREDENTQRQIYSSASSIPQEQTMAGSVGRGLTGGLLRLPSLMVAGPEGAPLMAYLGSLHRGNRAATIEAIKMLPLVAGFKLAGGLTAGSSVVPRALAGSGTGAGLFAGTDYLSGERDPKKLTEDAMVGAGMGLLGAVGRGEGDAAFERPSTLDLSGRVGPMEGVNQFQFVAEGLKPATEIAFDPRKPVEPQLKAAQTEAARHGLVVSEPFEWTVQPPNSEPVTVSGVTVARTPEEAASVAGRIVDARAQSPFNHAEVGRALGYSEPDIAEFYRANNKGEVPPRAPVSPDEYMGQTSKVEPVVLRVPAPESFTPDPVVSAHVEALKPHVTDEASAVQVLSAIGIDPEHIEAGRRLALAEQTPAPETVPEVPGTVYGSRNRLVNETSAQAARDALKAMLAPSRLHDLSDFVSALPHLATLGAYHLEAMGRVGASSFASWSQKMIDDVGEEVRPHLREIYAHAHTLLGEPLPKDAPQVNIPGPRTPLLRTFVELYRAGILASGKLLLHKVTSDVTFQALEEMKRAPAVIADMAVASRTGLRSVAAPSLRAMARSGLYAATHGLSDAGRIIREGATPEQLARYGAREVNSGSRIVDAYVNYTYRVYGATDAVMRSYAMRRSLEAQGRVWAVNEARNGKIEHADIAARSQELANNPTPEMQAQATTDSIFATLANDNAVTAAREGMRKKLQTTATGRGIDAVADVAVPFLRTSTNIVARTVEYSPAGMLKAALNATSAARRAAFTEGEQKSFAETFGRSVTGSSLMLLGYALAQRGYATGASDDDSSQARLNEATGRQANALYNPTTKTWHSVAGIGPAGTLLAMGATVYQDTHGERPSLMRGAVDAADVALNRSPLGRALELPTSRADAASAAGRKVGSFIPQPVADLATLTDSHERDARGFTGQVLSRVPGMRESLPVKVDALGHEVEFRRSQVLDPTRTTSDKTGDALLAQLVEIGKGLGQSFRRPYEKAADFAERQKREGQLIETVWRDAVKTDTFQKAAADDEERRKLLARLAGFARLQLKDELPESFIRYNAGVQTEILRRELSLDSFRTRSPSAVERVNSRQYASDDVSDKHFSLTPRDLTNLKSYVAEYMAPAMMKRDDERTPAEAAADFKELLSGLDEALNAEVQSKYEVNREKYSETNRLKVRK